MRHITTFVSLPQGTEYERLAREVIMPISRGRLEIQSMLDRPADNAPDYEVGIRRCIAHSNIVIGIVSDRFENVMYELGLAVAYGKPLITLTNSLQKLPSMVRVRHTIDYARNGGDDGRLGKDIVRSMNDLFCLGIHDERLRNHVLNIVWQEILPNAHNGQDEIDIESENSPFATGCREYRSRRYERAIPLLEEAVGTGAGGDRTYFYLADAYFLRGEMVNDAEAQRRNYEMQLAWACRGAEIFPEARDIKKTLGLAHLKLGHLVEAERIFTQLLQDHPEYHVARYDLACVYALQDQAMSCITVLTELFGRSGFSAQWRALAKVDPDFEYMWEHPVFQRVLFPAF